VSFRYVRYRAFFGEQGPPLQVSKWAFPSISLTGFAFFPPLQRQWKNGQRSERSERRREAKAERWNLLKLATLRQNGASQIPAGDLQEGLPQQIRKSLIF
jgi:hypothetical protein